MVTLDRLGVELFTKGFEKLDQIDNAIKALSDMIKQSEVFGKVAKEKIGDAAEDAATDVAEAAGSVQDSADKIGTAAQDAAEDVAESSQTIAVSGKRIEGASRGVLKFVQALSKIVGVSVSIYAAINGIKNLVLEAAKLRDVARRTGETAQALDSWGRAVASVGGDVGAFQNTITGLNKTLRTAAYEGGEVTSFLAHFGISMRDASGQVKQGTDVLLELADSWTMYSEQDRYYIADKLGLDEGTIRLMMKGRDAMEANIAAQKEYYTMSEETAEAAADVVVLWGELKTIWKAAGAWIVSFLIPPLKFLLTVLRDVSAFIVKHKPVLVAALTGLAYVAAKVFGPSLVGVAKILTGVLNPAMYKSIAAMIKMGASWLVAFWPVALVVAAIAAIGAAIYLLVDDYLVWKNGGNALLGSVWEKFDKVLGGIRKVLEFLGGYLKRFWDDPKKAWNDAINFLKERWKNLSLAEIIKDILVQAGRALVALYDLIIKPWWDTLNELVRVITGVDIMGAVGALWDGVVWAFTDGWAALKSWWASVDLYEDVIKVFAGFGRAVVDALAKYNPITILAATIEAILSLLSESDFFGPTFKKIAGIGIAVMQALQEYNPITLIMRMFSALFEAIETLDLYEAGANLIKSLVGGIKDWIPSLGGVWDSIKSMFGFGSEDAPEVPQPKKPVPPPPSPYDVAPIDQRPVESMAGYTYEGPEYRPVWPPLSENDRRYNLERPENVPYRGRDAHQQPQEPRNQGYEAPGRTPAGRPQPPADAFVQGWYTPRTPEDPYNGLKGRESPDLSVPKSAYVPAAATVDSGGRGDTIIDAPTTIGHIQINVPGGDAKKIASSIQNEIKQQQPTAWYFDGALGSN